MKLLSGSEILHKGWDLYTANIKRFTVWGALFIVMQLIGQYAQGALTFSFVEKYGQKMGAEAVAEYVPWMDVLQNTLGGTGLLFSGVVFGLLFGVVMVYLMMGSLTNTADMEASVKEKTPAEYMKAATPLFWPMVWIGVLSSVLIVVGFMFLVIPGILFSVWFMFASYEVLFTKNRGVEAIKTSKALVSGRFWQVFWRIVVVYFVIMVFSLIAAFAISLLDSVVMSMVGREVLWLSIVLFMVPNLVLVPYTIAMQYIFYRNLKETKEGKTDKIKPEDLAPVV